MYVLINKKILLFAWEECTLEHSLGRKGCEVVTVTQIIHGKQKEGKVQFPTEEHLSPWAEWRAPGGSLWILGDEGEQAQTTSSPPGNSEESGRLGWSKTVQTVKPRSDVPLPSTCGQELSGAFQVSLPGSDLSSAPASTSAHVNWQDQDKNVCYTVPTVWPIVPLT